LLGLDGEPTVALFLDQIVLLLLQLADLVLVIVEIENLVPNRLDRRVDVLNANGRSALGGIVGNDLLHDGVALGEFGLLLGGQSEAGKGTGFVGREFGAVRVRGVAILFLLGVTEPASVGAAAADDEQEY